MVNRRKNEWISLGVSFHLEISGIMWDPTDPNWLGDGAHPCRVGPILRESKSQSTFLEPPCGSN